MRIRSTSLRDSRADGGKTIVEIGEGERIRIVEIINKRQDWSIKANVIIATRNYQEIELITIAGILVLENEIQLW